MCDFLKRNVLFKRTLNPIQIDSSRSTTKAPACAQCLGVRLLVCQSDSPSIHPSTVLLAISLSVLNISHSWL